MQTSTLTTGNKLQEQIKLHKEHSEAVRFAIKRLDEPEPYEGSTELVARYSKGNKNKMFEFCSEFMTIQPKPFLELYLHNIENKIKQLQKEFDEL